MRLRPLLSSILCVTMLASTVRADDDEPQQQVKVRAALRLAKISLAEAMKTARQGAPSARPYHVELTLAQGRPVIHVDSLEKGKFKSVSIDAVSGRVLAGPDEAAGEPDPTEAAAIAEEVAAATKAITGAKVSFARLIQTVEQKAPGIRIYEIELIPDEQGSLYELSVLDEDQFFDVQIDAVDGRALDAREQSKLLAVWNFDKDAAGKLPAGWSIQQNNPTKAMATWKVMADAQAVSGRNVLTVKTANENATFNIAVVDKSSHADVDLHVSVRGDSGELDQGGGLIWRYQDENNYYVCRINPLEPNFRVYKVVDGKRVMLQDAKVETETGQWYRLRAVMRGDRIRCFLDGEKLLDVKDKTFSKAGRIGLWTKADASSAFDDLMITSGNDDDEPVAAVPPADAK